MRITRAFVLLALPPLVGACGSIDIRSGSEPDEEAVAPINIGQTINEEFAESDAHGMNTTIDVFRFAGKPGETVTFTGRALAENVRVRLYIWSKETPEGLADSVAQDNPQFGDTNGPHSELVVTLPEDEDGLYYLYVYGDGESGPYSVTMLSGAVPAQDILIAKKEGPEFQWGKFAAIAAGAAATGALKDEATRTAVLKAAAADSQEGVEGMSNSTSLATALGAGKAASGISALGGQGTQASSLPRGTGSGGSPPKPGSYALPMPLKGSKPNLVDAQGNRGAPCYGYDLSTYREHYEANGNGPDAQLHALCAGAFNYYWMYQNAFVQGYTEEQAAVTYTKHKEAAAVVVDFWNGSRGGTKIIGK